MARPAMSGRAGPGGRTTLQVGGRSVSVTSLDRVLYPATGTTKRDVIAYLVEVSPALLPVLADRPVSRKRWPDGVGGVGFFEKNVPTGAPGWLPRVRLGHEYGDATYPLVDEVAALVWLGQTSALELHVPQWRFPASHPDAESARDTDRLVLDLDPGEPAGLAEAAQVALTARRLLAEAGLESVAVTSGSKGIHVYAPVPRPLRRTLPAAEVVRAVAERLEAALPRLVVLTMTRSRRAGKVLVDWSQNNPAKTTVAPYSLRGRDRPWVAAPRRWDEIEGALLRQLSLTEVVERVREGADPWRTVFAADH